jgi:hypothetical protein
MIKATSIAGAAKSIGDLAGGIADIKAEEEAISAVSSYSNEIAKAHEELQETGIEVDDMGNLVYDEKQILKTEYEVRSTLSGTIRENIKSAAAKRHFDNWMAQKGGDASLKFRSEVTAKSAEVITQNVDLQIESLLDADQFDAADERNAAAVASGAYGPGEYKVQRDAIKTRRVINGAWDQINAAAIDKDKDQINEQLDQLQDPSFTGIDDVSKNQLINKLSAILEGNDGVLEEEIQEGYRQTYMKLLPTAHAGDLPLSTLIASGIPPDNPLFTRLLGMLNGEEGPSGERESLPGAMQSYRTRIRGLNSRSGVLTDDNWETSRQALIEEMNDPDSGLIYTDSEKLIADLDADYKAIFSNPVYQNTNRQAYQSLTGYEPGAFDNMEAMFSSQFKKTNMAGLQFQEELAAKAMQLGPRRQGELDAWFDAQVPIQRVKLNDQILTSVGVNLDWDSVSTTGFDDAVVKDIKEQMYAHLDKYPKDLSKAKEAIEEIGRLNGIMLLKVIND